MKEREVRVYPLEGVEARADDDGFGFTGYAAVFNARSDDLGGFREIISPGAFSKTLQEADVRALFNHDTNLVLGRNRAGTLRMEEDSTGLRVDVDLPDTTYARDLHALMKRGDVNQMSFAFTKIKDAWNDAEAPPLRTLNEVRLHDVSVVTVPAYPQTSAEARDHAAALAGMNVDVTVPGVDINFRELFALESELREGKVLSRKNKDLLSAAIEALSQLLAASEPEPDPTPEANASPEPDEKATTPASLDTLARRLRLMELAG